MEIRFRPVCSGLKESMLEMRKFNSMNSFMLFLKAKYENSLISRFLDYSNVSFNFQCKYDDRIGWKNIFIVLINGEPYGYITCDNVDIKKYIDICKIV